MADVKDQVCLNHTDRPAASRCETCFKPLCDDCIVETDGVHFCSSECAANYGDSEDRLQSIEDSERKRRARKRRRRVLLFIVAVAIVAAAYSW